jgi:hypothetical protein
MSMFPSDRLTGTFFCDMTTAQSLPLIPTDMIFDAVIALKAYSRAGLDRRLGNPMGY